MNVTAVVAQRIGKLKRSRSLPGFEWAPGVARYRNRETGRFVSEKTLLSLGEEYLTDKVGQAVERLTERMITGDITLPVWQERMAAELKNAHRVEMMLGRGGRKTVNQSGWGKLGSRLRQEYRYLNQFAAEIKAGSLTAGQIRVRARLYASAARVSFYDGLTAAKRAGGYLEERRTLGPAHKHCDDCLRYAGMGWQPLGALPEPGTECQCQRNCVCQKTYRKGDEPA